MYFIVKNLSNQEINFNESDYQVDNFNLEFKLFDNQDREISSSETVTGFHNSEDDTLKVLFAQEEIDTPSYFKVYLDSKEIYRSDFSFIKSGFSAQTLNDGYCNIYIENDASAKMKSEEEKYDAEWAEFLSNNKK